ncbi:MAG: DUF1295 domain-containing protein [Pseudomonadota bacterium]
MAQRNNGQSVFAIAIAVLIGSAMAWAGSDGGDQYRGLPVFAICGALAFAVNWIAFVPAALGRTEHFYDLTGGITYLTVTAAAVYLAGSLDLRALLVAAMIAVWALRLSIFLFRRISADGSDSRFDGVRDRPLRFLMAWTLQGVWVLLTAAAALAIITGGNRVPLEPLGIAGIVVWLAGMTIEVIADRQKSRFRKNPDNKGKFINTGLWAWSRHPNYFGEIVLWTGIALMAIPVLTGWQWATLVSPLFVTFLLTKVSGIPLLEQKADSRWGGQADYETYKASTPVLILKPPKAA